MILSHSPASRSSAERVAVTPELLTTMLAGPSRCTTSATPRSTLGRIGYIHGDRDGGSVADGRHIGLQLVLAARGQRHLGAGRGQSLGEVQAEPARGARYQGHLAAEIETGSHDASPRQSGPAASKGRSGTDQVWM